MNDQKIICWFSCGAASAVASKEAIALFAPRPVHIVNCDTRSSEHPDNYRFSADCERWFGQPIAYIKSADFGTVDDVIGVTKYMAGVRGARCTTELKKLPRLKFAAPDDIHVFGYTFDEKGDRRRKFEERNPDMLLRWVLIELKITKADCHRRIAEAGIKSPAMYELGFDNNNCPGCVKASSPWYWDMVRRHFPDVFSKRCQQSRLLGVRLVEISFHNRIFLDELPSGPFKRRRKKENLSCGPECGMNLPGF